MAKENRCLRCGAQMPADAPEGLCPKCLMKGVMSKEDADVTLESPRIEGPGTTIGRYKLLELIGEGGMGLVYLAEQQEPIRRRAALKIVKLGMDTKQVIARFEAERQMLALLDHPNIARVYDAGTTEAGRPYFVMEYVKGQSITEYCDQHKTSIEDRLKLFRQVCEAVQYAHQKGIIHRDIKPSNILVSVEGDRAVPKIIDFGIAKAVTQQFTEGTLFTQQGQLLGTPEYMSPEQTDLATQDIDTRSDIYSLGVVLYQLLAGVLPFGRESFERGGFAEIQRVIQEVDPPNPSTALSKLGEEAKKIAERRKTQVVPLARRLHRELEWIPLKAMRKERVRRYRSASELADDIQNYLNGNPLIAGPETAMYRVKKFVRRHAGSVATVALVAAAIVLGLVISTVMYFRAEQARKSEAIARNIAEQAEKVAQEQKGIAETKAEELRRTLYVSNIQLADAKYKEGNISRVHELLNACPNDLRGWEWNRLNYISDQSIMTLHGHDAVFSAVYTIDGRRIISGGYDGTVRIWDAATGKELKVFRGHKGPVQSVAVSRDGQYVVSGSWDKTIKVWDTESGQEVTTMLGHKDVLWCVALSPDGKVIASVDPGETMVRLWDAKTGEELMPLRGHKSGLDHVVFSPDGKHVISGDSSGDIKFWDAATRKELMSLHAHDGFINKVAVKSDGSQIASVGGWDNEVRVWDAETGTLVMTARGHGARVESVAFSQDGKYFASGDAHNTIKVWSAATGENLVTLRGHEGTVGAIAFSPNGKHLISGSEDGMVKVWDASINREAVKLAGHQTPVTWVAFSPDGKRIVSTGDDWMVKLWDVESGTEMMLFHTGSHDKAMCPVAFSPDGKLIASSCSRGTIKVWDAETAADVATLSGMGPRSWGLAFSPDSSRVVAASWTMAETSEVVETVIKIWDVRKGVEILNIPLVGSMAMSVAFSPDGQRIVSGAWDGRIRIWEASNGADIMTIKAHEMPIHCVAFSPDGKSIISASGDRTTKIWDAITGTETMTLRGHGDRVVSAQFSPDGKRIITGSNDGTAKLWDAVTGAELLTFPSQRGADDVAFSPDGKTIAVGTFEGRVVLWESAPPVGGYETRRNGAAAQKIIDELYKKHNFYHDVIDNLNTDNILAEPIRKLALQIANSRKWEDAEKLKEQIWEVVRLSVGDPNAYRAALANTEKANTLEPNDPSIFNLLGAAQYRVGKYEDALKTLTSSEKIREGKQAEPEPANMAFTAMSLHKLGRVDEAKAALERLRTLLKDERFAQDEQAKALLEEAEELIEGEK